MQTLQTTSHCFQHATRLELTDCELYMERRIEIIRKEKRDAMQTLQATAHFLKMLQVLDWNSQTVNRTWRDAFK